MDAISHDQGRPNCAILRLHRKAASWTVPNQITLLRLDRLFAVLSYSYFLQNGIDGRCWCLLSQGFRTVLMACSRAASISGLRLALISIPSPINCCSRLRFIILAFKKQISVVAVHTIIVFKPRDVFILQSKVAVVDFCSSPVFGLFRLASTAS